MKKLFLITIFAIIAMTNYTIAQECTDPTHNHEKPHTHSHSNDNVDKITAQRILEIYGKTEKAFNSGSGPFYAVIYDKDGNIVAEMANSVVKNQNPTQHAEMNAIEAAAKKLGTYDFAPHDLSMYVNAEPCMMCAGAIMWSGIKNVYYGVPSDRVEAITGFDEGFKPDWIQEFKNRGITVQGNIEQQAGEKVMQKYMDQGKEVYKPSR